MTPCFAVEFETPKKYILRGLWFGPPARRGGKKPRRTVLWVHGLGSSAFSMHHVTKSLLNKNTGVLTFNNRGHDIVSKTHCSVGKRGILGGTAHEKFTDCVDDIQGAINFARKQGVKNIYLAGHSTGCQKSIYWAYRKKSRVVKGIILLAPISDWSAEMHLQGKKKIDRATKIARQMVQRGKKHELLPPGLWHQALDAQRFLSLCTPDSVEEIFSYAQPNKNPRTLRSVRKPLLVLLAEKDEYADRPAKEIAAWFEKNLTNKHKVVIISGVKHSFKGAEKRVAKAIKEFIAVQ
ncbi:MAG TPA: alpha/beta fold hydrolase [Candidatus Paceibacterota bacterium]